MHTIVTQPPVGTSINKNHPLAKGLVGCWLLNEGGGKKAIDSSGMNQLEGVVSSSSVFTVKQRGSCVSFPSGANSMVNLGTQPIFSTLTGNMTLSAWINTSTVGSGVRNITGVFGAGSSGTIFDINRTAGKLDGTWANTVIATGSVVLSINTWYHVVMVRYGSTGSWTCDFYINGVLDNSTSGIATNPNAGTFGIIGALASNSAPFFGFINDVKMYNRALSASEIRQLYTSPYSMFLFGKS